MEEWGERSWHPLNIPFDIKLVLKLRKQRLALPSDFLKERLILYSIGIGIGVITELMNYEKVRVWETDTLHGDSPFTEQPGQCGEEGDYIQVKMF